MRVQEQTVIRFGVKNLDCAACAAKIERGLQKTPGVDDAVLDFASLTLHVNARDVAWVQETVRGIDPGVELVPRSGAATPAVNHVDPPGFNLRKELVLLAVAVLLFIPLLVWEPGFHQDWPRLHLLAVLTAYLLAGWNVFRGALRTLRNGTFFDENVLMVIATVGALAIQAYSEAVGVMIFYKVGEILQSAAVSHSRRSIQALLAAKPDKARIQLSNGYRETSPESVGVGELILVKPGEKIPLDGEVVSGSSQLDTSALTGESMPVSAVAGDAVMAGQISTTGALTVRVSRLFDQSSIARVMELVEDATARKARTETFITTFARYYTPAVVAVAAAIALIPPLLVPGAAFQDWIYRALVLLVISCPCALVVSIPLGYFGGIGNASRKGILVKGSNYIDALAAVDAVVFDKTGTLTRGVFRVTQVVSLNGYTESQLLEFAAAAEYHSGHPIAASILSAFSQAGGSLDTSRMGDHIVVAGAGVKARYKGYAVLVGNDNFLHLESIDHDQCTVSGTVVHVAVDGIYAGYLGIGDEVRPDAGQTIDTLRKLGVAHIAMLTGDNHCAAQSVANQLGIDRFDADLLPEDKVKIFEQISAEHHGYRKVAVVGDGINDAPVLARADVGVAMGALGSDAAIETADVVLMTDSPLKMAEAIAIGQQTRRIVWQNIALVFVVKGVFITLGAMGLASMWGAVFADMGTALLAVFNSMRALRS